MEFIVKQTDLLTELSAVSGAVKERTTIPILAHALVTTDGDSLKIAATDLEFNIETRCPAQVRKPGSGTVPLSKLLALTKLLPSDSFVEFALAENKYFDLKNGKRKYKMPGFDVSNFPTSPKAPAKNIQLPGAVLSKLISRITFAISDDESRYTLSGALMILMGAAIRFVATDGHRMAVADSPVTITGLSELEQRVLVPKRALVELQKMLSGANDETKVEFSSTDSHLFFSVGQRTLCSRLLTGQFPNYEAVFPNGNDKTASVNCDELISVIQRVTGFSDDRTNAVRVDLAVGRADFSSKSPEYGEASESIVTEYSKEDMAIAFNGKYVLDFLAVAPPGTINMKFKDARSAGEFSPAAGDPYRYIVMPLALNESAVPK